MMKPRLTYEDVIKSIFGAGQPEQLPAQSAPQMPMPMTRPAVIPQQAAPIVTLPVVNQPGAKLPSEDDLAGLMEVSSKPKAQSKMRPNFFGRRVSG